MSRSFKILGPLILACFFQFGSWAQVQAESVELIFLVEAPNSAQGLKVYLAGNFQGWNPGHPDYQFEELEEGVYRFVMAAEIGQNLQFKFTQGSWATVEKGPKGQEMANRTLRVEGPGQQNYKIYNWADASLNAPRSHTLSGDVRLAENDLFADGRAVRIYLPPQYATNPDRHFPVLYFFDGQNVFDHATSFVGEWEVDETCERLIAAGRVQPLIVVGVDNGGGKRSLEYTPWPDPDFSRGQSGGGQEHLQFLIDRLMPLINERYRSLTGPENTGLAGSSFGGLMTLYAAGEHSDTFGRLAAFSPSLWWHKGQPVAHAAQRFEPGIRLYVDMGAQENNLLEDGDSNGIDDNIDDLRRLKKSLLEKGFREGEDLMVVEDLAGRHHESSWARRFPAALEFLFPTQ